MIDIHTHLKIFHRTTEEQLIKSMNDALIDKSILLPLETPEANVDYYFLTTEAIEAYKKYPDRFIPFCCFDPRVREDFNSISHRIEKCVELGCKGFGEYKVPFAIDDSRSEKIYEICGKISLPILLHIEEDSGINYNYGMEKFGKILNKFPEANFIAHGPAVWQDIKRLDALLLRYPNLYADVSPPDGSGGTALKKNLDYTIEFLSRHKNRILFGTDFPYTDFPCVETNIPQQKKYIDFFSNLNLSKETFTSITQLNAKRLLRI